LTAFRLSADEPALCSPSPEPFAAALRHIAAVLELLCDNLHTTQINPQPDENSPKLCLQRLNATQGSGRFKADALTGTQAHPQAATIRIYPKNSSSSRDSNAIQAIRHSSGEFTGLAIPAAVPSSLGSET
jgi:hypothetical protein